ncbi:MAG: hypothetical protein Q8L78_04400 [Coxiellaceae bacterium]|nr:hypothetical protein [Coxiellaceae bacterium]
MRIKIFFVFLILIFNTAVQADTSYYSAMLQISEQRTEQQAALKKEVACLSNDIFLTLLIVGDYKKIIDLIKTHPENFSWWKGFFEKRGVGNVHTGEFLGLQNSILAEASQFSLYANQYATTISDEYKKNRMPDLTQNAQIAKSLAEHDLESCLLYYISEEARYKTLTGRNCSGSDQAITNYIKSMMPKPQE